MCVNLTKYIGGLSNIFNLFFEQFLLVVVICKLITNKNVVIKYLKFLSFGYIANALIGIIQTLAGVDAAAPLHMIIGRRELGLALRMGMTRAEGTTGSAILFACECAMMMLLMMYLYEITAKLRYMFFFGIFSITLICTMSRSSLIAVTFVIGLIFLMRFRQIIKSYIQFIPLIIMIGVGIVLLFPDKVNSLLEPIKSILNLIGGDYSLAGNFGDNGNTAAVSRTFQWTAVEYMFLNGNLLLGYGYKAYLRGMIHFYYSGYHAWDVAQAVDVGLVVLIAERGLLGFILYIYFVCKIIIESYKNGFLDKKNTNFYCAMFYILILYIICNILSASVDNQLIWVLFGLYCGYDKIAKKQQNYSKRIIRLKL